MGFFGGFDWLSACAREIRSPPWHLGFASVPLEVILHFTCVPGPSRKFAEKLSTMLCILVQPYFFCLVKAILFSLFPVRGTFNTRLNLIQRMRLSGDKVVFSHKNTLKQFHLQTGQGKKTLFSFLCIVGTFLSVAIINAIGPNFAQGLQDSFYTKCYLQDELKPNVTKL